MNSDLISDIVQRLVDYEKRLERLEAQEKLLVPVWEDLPPFPILAARLGATAPTLAVFLGSVYQYTFDNSNDYVYGATEITHMWKEGTTIYPHIHWATNGSEASAKGVQWQMKWVIGDGNEAFGTEITRSVDVEIPAGTATRTHLINEFSPAISGIGRNIGAYILWRLTRIATAHANGEPAADPYALAIGFHAEMNSLGSREKFVK